VFKGIDQASQRTRCQALGVSSETAIDGLHQSLVQERLDDVINRRELECANREAIVSCHEYNERHRIGANLSHHIDAAEPRHSDVKYDQIGLLATYEVHGSQAVRAFSNDFNVAARLKEPA
jgi:hypothetical protein